LKAFSKLPSTTVAPLSRDRHEGEGEMTPPRLKPPKWKWYVSFEPKGPVGKRSQARATETFRNEHDAKAFAKAKMADGSNVNAGTLNPHLPKRTITSMQMLDWLNEPDL
jgi:hypothetical protein